MPLKKMWIMAETTLLQSRLSVSLQDIVKATNSRLLGKHTIFSTLERCISQYENSIKKPPAFDFVSKAGGFLSNGLVLLPYLLSTFLYIIASSIDGIVQITIPMKA